MMATVKSGNLEITATDLGAELISVKHNGKERLWQNQNGGWSGHAPVLFPVCGACEMRVDGRVFPCPRHGFALKSAFTLAEKSENSLKYRLVSDAHTQELYPFGFVFEVEYIIQGDELKITYYVHNPDGKELYFSCGGHDSFSLEKEPKYYELEFEKDEEFESKLVTDGGYLTGKGRHLGTGRILDLNTDLLDDGNSICLDKLNSHSVTLREKQTEKAVVKVSFPHSQKLVLWRPHGAEMLCIEPWQNLPDTVGENAEFCDKDGVIKVAPFGKATVERTISYF